MTGLGTDALALTCILCGAAASGGLTWALMDGDAPAREDCAVEAVSLAPSIVVTGGSGHQVVRISEPSVRVHGGDCVREGRGSLVVDLNRVRTSVRRVEVDTDRIRREVEAARAEVERAREQLLRARERTAESKAPAAEEAGSGEIQILLESLAGAGKNGGGL